MKKIYLPLIGILVIIGVALMYWQPKPSTSLQTGSTVASTHQVITAPVVVMDIPEMLSGVGTVSSLHKTLQGQQAVVIYHLPFSQQHRLKTKQPVLIFLDKTHAQHLLGHVNHWVNKQISSKTIEVQAFVTDLHNQLKAGQHISVKQQVGMLHQQLLVSTHAIVSEGHQAFVWIVDAAGKAKKIPVTLGPTHKSLVVIEGSIQKNASVILGDLSSLKEGQDIRSMK